MSIEIYKFHYSIKQLISIKIHSKFKNSIRNILLTNIGSMPGRPTFGSRLLEIPFSQNDSSTQLALKRLIAECLSKWEKRIVLTNVSFPDTSYNNLVVKIDFYFKDASLNSTVSVSLLE